MDNYSFNDWRNNLGYVTQDSLLFNDSLKNNILVDGEYNSDSFKEILSLDLLTISKNKKVNIEKNIEKEDKNSLVDKAKSFNC